MSRQGGGPQFPRRQFFTEFFAQAAESAGERKGERPEREPGNPWSVIAATTGSLIAAEAISRMGQGEFSNMVPVKTQNADYQVVHSSHIVSSTAETVRPNTDALLLEMAGVLGRGNSGSAQDLFEPDQWETELAPYKYILGKAKEKGIPIFLVDITRPNRDELSLWSGRILKSVLSYLEAVFGITFALTAIDRRSFFKSTGLAILGAYLLSPTMETVALFAQNPTLGNPVEGSLSRSSFRGLRRFNETFHPELKTTMLDLRDAIIAQKAETVARILHKERGHRPKLNLYIGAEHVGVEQQLQSSDSERVNQVREYIPDPENLKWEGLIARIDFVKDKQGNEAVQVTLLMDYEFQPQE